MKAAEWIGFTCLIMSMAMVACGPSNLVVLRNRPAALVYRRPVAPGPGYVWMGDNYSWRGNRYVYQPGYWAAPRPGRTYVPGYWNRGRRGDVWVRGYWR